MGWFRASTIDQVVPEVASAPVVDHRLNFSDLRSGQAGRIVAVTSTSPEALRLQEMGLSVGAEFRIVEVAPFGDPVQVCLRGYRLCLRKREAKAFEVELIDKECRCDHRR
jgi:ferrous iron transport protein A